MKKDVGFVGTDRPCQLVEIIRWKLNYLVKIKLLDSHDTLIGNRYKKVAPFLMNLTFDKDYGLSLCNM